MKLFIDPDALKKEYAASPAWLQTLMNAFADGLNYYLCQAPEGEAQGHYGISSLGWRCPLPKGASAATSPA